MLAVMALQMGVKVASFSAASREVSKNSMVGKTQEMVGTHSEENCCCTRAGCCNDEVSKRLCRDHKKVVDTLRI
jgi:hypothetical protein